MKNILHKIMKTANLNLKCLWCEEDEKSESSSTNYKNPLTGDVISVMFSSKEKQMKVGFNNDLVGVLNINFCPICGKQF